GSVRTTWNEAVAVPQSQRPIWMELHLHKTLFGRISDIGFKMPIVEMMVTTQTGTKRKYRLVPSVANYGFLLSPLVTNVQEWSRLFADDDPSNNDAPTVVEVKINRPVPHVMADAYSDRFDVTFS